MKFIFHIGAGKTGSTSIQKTLQRNRIALKKNGIYYLGMMLNQNIKILKYKWQTHPAGSNIESFHKLEEEETTRQLLDVLAPVVRKAKEENIHTLIWSNESFFGRNYHFTKALEQLRDDFGINIEIVVYVREYASWIYSSYIQWGIKHKTYTGAVKPFKEWSAQYNTSFYKPIHRLMRKTDLKVIVKNMSAKKDVVSDFLEYAGIDPSTLRLERENISPSNEEIFFRSVYNSMFDSKVFIKAYNENVGNRIQQEVTVAEYFSSLVPDKKTVEELCKNTDKDRKQLNRLLVENGEVPIDECGKSRKNTLDESKVIMMLTQVVFDLSKRIEVLENTLDNFENDLKK